MSAGTATANTVASIVGSALRRVIEAERNAVKRIARRARSTPRAVENWAAELNAPRSAELIRLMAINTEIAERILALVEEERRCEPS